MTIVEYTKADGIVDYAPESYMNIGFQLAYIENAEYNVMLEAVNGGPLNAGGYPNWD